MDMRLIDIGNGEMVVSAVVDDTPLRVEDGGFGPEDVYRVRRLDIRNTTGRQWHVLIRQSGVGRFEQLVLDQTEAAVSLAPVEQFDTWELEVRVNANVP